MHAFDASQPADISAFIFISHSGHILDDFIHAVAYHVMQRIYRVRLCRFASMMYLSVSGVCCTSASAAFTVARAVAYRPYFTTGWWSQYGLDTQAKDGVEDEKAPNMNVKPVKSRRQRGQKLCCRLPWVLL
jgi:hypothetical protein